MGGIYISKTDKLKNIDLNILFDIDYFYSDRTDYVLNSCPEPGDSFYKTKNFLQSTFCYTKYNSKKSVYKNIDKSIILEIIYNKTNDLPFNLESGVYQPYFGYDTFFLLKKNISFSKYFNNKFWKCNILENGLLSDEVFIPPELNKENKKRTLFGLHYSNFAIIKEKLPEYPSFDEISLKCLIKNQKYKVLGFYYKDTLLCYLVSCNIKKPLGLLETFHSDENAEAEKICFLRKNDSLKYFCVLYSNENTNKYLFLQDTYHIDEYADKFDNIYFDIRNKKFKDLYFENFPNAILNPEHI